MMMIISMLFQQPMPGPGGGGSNAPGGSAISPNIRTSVGLRSASREFIYHSYDND